MGQLDGEAAKPLDNVIVKARTVGADNVAFELARHKLLYCMYAGSEKDQNP